MAGNPTAELGIRKRLHKGAGSAPCSIASPDTDSEVEAS